MVEFYDPIAKQNISYHLDKKLQERWDNLRNGKLIEMNEDRVYIVDGRERTGKSSFAFQQAKYLDPYFDVDNICFKPDEFLHKIKTARKGSVIVFDEAFRGLSSKATRSKVNKAIVEAMMEMGQRNLIVFIVLPTIFLLELYAAVFRSEALFHIYKTKNKNDGKNNRAFKIYNYNKKKQLYLNGKTKYFSYSYPKIFRAKGRFLVKRTDEYPNGLPYSTFDMKAYEKKKAEAFKSEQSENAESKYKLQRDKIIANLYKRYFKTYIEISEWLASIGIELDRTAIGLIVRQAQEKKENERKRDDKCILDNEENQEGKNLLPPG